jgi:hypothetical protein
MAGGIQKYPPTGGSPTPSYPQAPPAPPTAPAQPPPPPPAPPITPTVLPNPGVINNVDTQINYSNMSINYFKIDLYNTKSNLYGEATEKWYYPPVNVKCLLERGDITNSDTEYGVDVNQTLKITVSKTEFETTYNFTPEVGDIISDQNRYYEISSINISYITTPGAGTSTTTTGNPGQIILYVLSAYLTRTSKLNLIKYSI